MINCIIVGLISFIVGCIAGSFITLLGVSAGSSVTRKAVDMNAIKFGGFDLAQEDEKLNENPNENIKLM